MFSRSVSSGCPINPSCAICRRPSTGPWKQVDWVPCTDFCRHYILFCTNQPNIVQLGNSAQLLHWIYFTEVLQCGRWEVVTETGLSLRCQHVLVAAGGYAALKPLFKHVKPGMVPKLELMTATVAYLQICKDEAHRLRQVHWTVSCL